MPELTFNTSILRDTADMVREPLRLPGLPDGARGRVLRRLDDGSIRSVLVEAPAGWSTGQLSGAAPQQGFVLDGQLRDDSTALAAGTFFFHPGGHAFGWQAPAGARFILIFNAPQRYAAGNESRDGAILALRPEDVAVTPSLIDGKPTGVVRRVLWKDPVTGADTRHLTIPAGVSGLGAEWHPCNEEIFCLTRDAAPGDAHPFRAGYFLFNPAYAVHGGNRTVNAAETTMLEWHDGLWEIHRHTG
jgi:hypothetical protein